MIHKGYKRGEKLWVTIGEQVLVAYFLKFNNYTISVSFVALPFDFFPVKATNIPNFAVFPSFLHALEYALEQENKWQWKLVKNRLKSIDKRHKKV